MGQTIIARRGGAPWPTYEYGFYSQSSTTYLCNLSKPGTSSYQFARKAHRVRGTVYINDSEGRGTKGPEFNLLRGETLELNLSPSNTRAQGTVGLSEDGRTLALNLTVCSSPWVYISGAVAFLLVADT